MTIESKIESELVNHGLWPDESKAVLAELKSEKWSAPMTFRWSDNEAGYPPFLINFLVMASKRKALEWIDLNAPKHFARAALES